VHRNIIGVIVEFIAHAVVVVHDDGHKLEATIIKKINKENGGRAMNWST
jgi:hypothetical protein